MFTVSQGHEPTHRLPIWTLEGAGHVVKLLPEAGFNLYYWTYDGGEMLMEPTDIREYGSKYGIPLLFPTPNRIRDARYTWKDREIHQVKRGVEVQRHGLVMTEPWDVRCEAREDCAVAVGTISIYEGSPLFEGYPFPCRLTVTYTLRADGLHLSVRVENLGGEEMPFGFAIHPYFSKRGDACKAFLTAPVHRVYETDENLLPSGVLTDVSGSDKDISDGLHSVESLYLDNVFRGMTQDLCAQVVYEGVHPQRVTLRGGDAFRNLVVFTPHDRPGFCLEHQTCATDFINLYGKGLIDESSILILPAGQTFESFVDLTVENL